MLQPALFQPGQTLKTVKKKRIGHLENSEVLRGRKIAEAVISTRANNSSLNYSGKLVQTPSPNDVFFLLSGSLCEGLFTFMQQDVRHLQKFGET